MASFFNEFKTFAMRGNVVDQTVGGIIGGALGAIVTRHLDAIIMPPIGRITGGHDLSNFFLPLNGEHYATLAEAKAHTAVIAYGNFINNVVNFLIIAFAIFLIVKLINRLHPPPSPPAVGPTPEVLVLTEIRDLLKPRV